MSNSVNLNNNDTSKNNNNDTSKEKKSTKISINLNDEPSMPYQKLLDEKFKGLFNTDIFSEATEEYINTQMFIRFGIKFDEIPEDDKKKILKHLNAVPNTNSPVHKLDIKLVTKKTYKYNTRITDDFIELLEDYQNEIDYKGKYLPFQKSEKCSICNEEIEMGEYRDAFNTKKETWKWTSMLHHILLHHNDEQELFLPREFVELVIEKMEKEDNKEIYFA